ncbi:hypothetical protein DFH28DRAFT_474738 [Melampsora americana]|nr:hypothetical protein DFH28DRAFT_474738 [Melampsora americana]
MVLVLRCQGILQLLFLTSVSLQMEHSMDMRNFDKHFLSNGEMSYEANQPTYTFSIAPSVESPSLELSLGSSQQYQMSDIKNPKTIPTHQDNFGGKSVDVSYQQEGQIKPMDLLSSPNKMSTSHFNEQPFKGTDQTGSGKPWISLAPPEPSSTNKLPGGPGVVHPPSISMDSNKGTKWLTLGPQESLPESFEGKSAQEGVEKGIPKIQMRPPREGIQSSSHYPQNQMNYEGNSWRESLGLKSFDPQYHRENFEMTTSNDPKGAVHNYLQNSISQSQEQVHHKIKAKAKISEKDFITEHTMPKRHKNIQLDYPTIEELQNSKRKMNIQPQISVTEVPKMTYGLGQRPLESVKINTEKSLPEIIYGFGNSGNFIPGSLKDEIQIWLNELEYDILNRVISENQNGFVVDKITRNLRRLMQKTENTLSTFFLSCLKLLHGNICQNVKDGEKGILKDGWEVLKKVLIQWKELDFKSNAGSGIVRSPDHLDLLNPSALHDLMLSRKKEDIGMELFWDMYKRWYRESKFPYKRFLGTRQNFNQQLKISVLNHRKSELATKEQQEIELHQSIYDNGYHQDIFNHHFLQFPGFLHQNTDHQPKNNELVHLIRYLGDLEVELLEHHEPVAEWFEKLHKDLRVHLTRSGIHDKASIQRVSTCVKHAFERILPQFFGLLKLMEDPRPVQLVPLRIQDVPVREVDSTVLKGWEFMKTHLGHWTHLDLKRGLHAPFQHWNLADFHAKASYSLFHKLLRIRGWNAPFVHIWKLYYLHTTIPSLPLDRGESIKQATHLQVVLETRLSNLKRSLHHQHRGLWLKK